ncbi:DUF3106 domain-containing protein [Lysobacter auxotrophicus]|uniref:DUF3106 domain-containing protein n=1 Tax=Lysobacter auxotrophicus TaxID=2992573 RepID=A0ABM8D998_9GAMM|nr:DUF3106 domain-containing protein [Lysobacter auxotrophicus]BDU15120.1 DUF3106 domain-containing protein [Lysobacter auxotrophicus]
MRRKPMRGRWTLLALVLVAAVAGSTPPELKEVVQHLPPARQAELRENARRWDAWSPAEQQAFRQQAARWDALPRAQRDERRERWLAWQALSPAERAQAQAAAAQYAAMPPDLQGAWRAQFNAMDRSERRGWLLGPAVGAEYAMLQPLLAQVPEAERAALLRTLRSMTSQQRRELGVLAQRTPPNARAALRRELVSVSAQERGDWLWRRLQH